jgi:hypothetical protein
MNTMRRREDRAEVEAQLADIDLGWARLDSLWYDLQWRIFNGEHNRPELRSELERMWTDAEGEAGLLGHLLDPSSLDALIAHVEERSAPGVGRFIPAPKAFRMDAFHVIDCNGPGLVYQLDSEEDRARARATLINEGCAPVNISASYALELLCVGVEGDDEEEPWDLRDVPAWWLEGERPETTLDRKSVEST